MTSTTDKPTNERHGHNRYMTQAVEAAALTRLELAIIRVYEAFGRWAVELHKLGDDAARPIGFNDIAILHCTRMRGHEPSLSELLHFLNRHDIANLQYSLKKLTKYGLVESCAGSSRRESRFALTPLGMQITDKYAAVRNDVLITLLQSIKDSSQDLTRAALTLEHLIGTYDQASQAVLNRHILCT
jgi:predicted MarR family transcription regulator